MKKMNLTLLHSPHGVKKAARKVLLMCSFVVGFLVFGFQTASAQFVDKTEALSILEAEMTTVYSIFSNASVGSNDYIEYGRKHHYYKRLFESVYENDDIAQAIQDDVIGLPTYQSNASPSLDENTDVTSPSAATAKNLIIAASTLLTE